MFEQKFVDFRHDIAPILGRRCGPCHDADEDGASAWTTDTPAGVRRAYERLLAPRERGEWVIAWNARESDMTRRLLDRKGANGGGASGWQTITDDEARRILEWIDLGAAWDARAGEVRP